ncbi:NELL2 protein, partial [Atractosteus spatula]|nr:NELL2 protein [Atractosteus spatula]
TVFLRFQVLGFGVDPDLQINIFKELQTGESLTGVSQVQGFHNESRAFLFQDTSRNIKASPEIAERMLQKLRNKSEFTVLVTLKQERLNSGVILSIHHSDQRYLELESSGHRNEIRLHYRTKSQQAHTEIFPYTLADNQWHKVSIAVSASHVILHIDCNRIYERVVETPSMDIPSETLFWLGQRNNAHGFFKVGLTKVTHFFLCRLKTGESSRAKVLSTFQKKINHSFLNGTVQCETLFCPPLQCSSGFSPAYVKGVCCKKCQRICLFSGRTYLDGERKAVYDSSGKCILFECRDRTMHRMSSEDCPELNCPESEQINLSDRCCKVCKGHDFCAEGHSCMENSECVNLEAGACCSCKDGFRALREDNAYCEDIDECAEGKHYCRENTMCVNTPGSFMCICQTGYIRIDDYSCTGK